ncbi:MAG: hypothetical protein U9Q19_06375, partial [Pseudomonadota bacterium]|nr:hypothetical protein [Pseudomonadota bacterium]
PHNDIASALMSMVKENREARVEAHSDLRDSINGLNKTVGALGPLMEDLRVALVGDDLGNPGVVHRQGALQGQLDQERELRSEADKRVHSRLDSWVEQCNANHQVLETKINKALWMLPAFVVGVLAGTLGIVKALGISL